MPTRLPVLSIMLAAGTRIKNPTPANKSPIENFIGVEGSFFSELSLSQSHANTPDRMMMKRALMACHHVEGNSYPKMLLCVLRSAKRVRVEPACSKADQKRAAAI